MNLPGGLTVHTEGAYLIFDRPGIEKEEQQSETELIVPGTVRYGKYRLTASLFLIKTKLFRKKCIRNGSIMIQLKIRFKYGPEGAVASLRSQLRAEERL